MQGSAQRRRQASRVAAADVAEDEDDVYGSRAAEASSPYPLTGSDEDTEGEEDFASGEEESQLPMTGESHLQQALMTCHPLPREKGVNVLHQPGVCETVSDTRKSRPQPSPLLHRIMHRALLRALSSH